MNIEKLTRKYFTLLNSKNLTELEEIYYPSITLKDWEGEYNTKDDVLRLNEHLFTLNLDFQILDIEVIQNTSYVLFNLINGNQKLKVLDVIQWVPIYPNEGKIHSIRAFKVV